MYVYATVSFLTVFIAAAFNLALGFLWYSSPVFGKDWKDMTGLSEENLAARSRGKFYAVMLASALLASFAVGTLLKMFGIRALSAAAKFGFLLWLGVILPSNIGDYLSVGRPKKLFFINMGYQLLAFVGMALIFSQWP